MIHGQFPRTDAAPFTPNGPDILLDEIHCDPAEDDFFDRWLFDFRQSLNDFRTE